MKCADFLSVLSAYIDGEIDRRTAKLAKEHLLKCASCRKAHKDMEALVQTVRSIDVPVPEHLADEVLAAVRKNAAAEKRQFRLPGFLTSWPMYSALAACLLLFTVFHAAPQHPVQNESLVYTGAETPSAPSESPVPATETAFSAAKNTRIMPGAKAAPAAESTPYLYAADVSAPYASVDTLARYRITFVAEDAAAKALFESAKGGGENAVITALSNAGYTVKTEIAIIEDCTAAYNALCEEANALSARAAEGDENARAAIAQKEGEMQAMREKCEKPELDFALAQQ